MFWLFGITKGILAVAQTCEESEAVAEGNGVVCRDEAEEENGNRAEKGDSANNWISIWSFVSDHLREVGTRRDAQLNDQITSNPNLVSETV